MYEILPFIVFNFINVTTPGIKGCGESISINDNIIPIELSAKKKQTQINDVASQLQLQHQLGVRK